MSNMTMLLCEHHPKLRWCCKTMSVSEGGRYTHERGITFFGHVTKDGDASRIIQNEDGTTSLAHECDCSPDLLIAVDNYKGDGHEKI